MQSKSFFTFIFLCFTYSQNNAESSLTEQQSFSTLCCSLLEQTPPQEQPNMTVLLNAIACILASTPSTLQDVVVLTLKETLSSQETSSRINQATVHCKKLKNLLYMLCTCMSTDTIPKRAQKNQWYATPNYPIIPPNQFPDLTVLKWLIPLAIIYVGILIQDRFNNTYIKEHCSHNSEDSWKVERQWLGEVALRMAKIGYPNAD